MLRHNAASMMLVLGSLFTAPMVHAGDFIAKEQLRVSSWNSVYTTGDGSQVHCKIKFNGDTGTYDTGNGIGRLTGIQYGVDTTSKPDKPFFQVTGKWSFQNQTGPFTLGSDGRDSFQGSWQGNGSQGKWTGTSTYTGWQKDPDKDRHFCEYRYPAKDNPATIHTQIITWYPNDAARTGYYYFANKESKIWGRCLSPKSPQYDPAVMQWSKLTDDNWHELPKGDCPAPNDGDPLRAAIDHIPVPPL